MAAVVSAILSALGSVALNVLPTGLQLGVDALMNHLREKNGISYQDITKLQSVVSQIKQYDQAWYNKNIAKLQPVFNSTKGSSHLNSKIYADNQQKSQKYQRDLKTLEDEFARRNAKTDAMADRLTGATYMNDMAAVTSTPFKTMMKDTAKEIKLLRSNYDQKI